MKRNVKGNNLLLLIPIIIIGIITLFLIANLVIKSIDAKDAIEDFRKTAQEIKEAT